VVSTPVSVGPQTAGDLGAAGAPERARRDGLPLGPLAIAIAARTVLLLVFDGRYGWQRDELYYALAGHHLQAGYVEFPPLTALIAWLSHGVWGDWLTGLRVFPALAGAGTMILAALVARDLGGARRAQWLAPTLVGFAPLMLATNGLFQPVSFDQTATMLVLWLAVRLCLGTGGWIPIGLAAGVGLETKYTLGVVLLALLASVAAWRRDLLRPAALAAAAAIALAIVLPNVIWQLGHHWASVEFFANPPPSASDESRAGFIGNLLLAANPVAVPVAVAGAVALWRRPALRPLAGAIGGTIVLFLVLGGKSYYAAPVVMFALAAGASPLERWAGRHRLWPYALAYGAVLLVAFPNVVPVLPLHTAIREGTIADRSDYRDELGWPGLVATVSAHTGGADVVIASNYGEAGALALYGHGLPAIASPDVTLRFWRPRVRGREAVLVGFSASEASFCRSYTVLARIRMPVANQERGEPVARCLLAGSLGAMWPRIVALAPL